MEPSSATNEKVGQLCSAWSILELHTEAALVGVVGFSGDQARAFLWKMGMRQKWQVLIKEASDRLAPEAADTYRSINKKIEIVMRDRNIVVHGLVHARIVPNTRVPNSMTHEEIRRLGRFTQEACWTVFMGEGAGKNYRVSFEAVDIIRENILHVTNQLTAINRSLGYAAIFSPLPYVESEWPKPF